MIPQTSILLRQAAKRVMWVITFAIVLVAVATTVFQRLAMEKYAQTILSSQERHYADQILLIEQDWQENATRLHTWIEFLNLFNNSLEEGLIGLRAIMATGYAEVFPLVLLVDKHNQILFKHQTLDVNLPEVFPALAPQGWYADPKSGRLLRWYAHPLWLGSGTKGRILMFSVMDNGLMFRHAMPMTDLFLVRDGTIWASSHGNKDQGAHAANPGEWWEGANYFTQSSIVWGNQQDSPPHLLIRLRSEPLFAIKELGIIGVAGLVIFIFLLWMALGQWILHHTRRIVTMGQVSRKFSEGSFQSAKILPELEAIQGVAGDEISLVVKSVAFLMHTVDLHTRTLENNAIQLQASEERFRTLTNSLQDTIVAFDLSGRIVYCNPTGEAIFGGPDEPLLDQSITRLFDPYWLGNPWQNKLLPASYQGVTTPDTLEGIAKSADGQKLAVEISISSWERGQEVFYTAVLRDISERRLMESRDLRAYVNRVAISALLEIALEPLPLRRKLEIALEIILTVPWLALLRKGSIFLVTEDHHLEMMVQKNLHPHLLSSCRKIPFGYCLCGRAAVLREIVYAQELDHRHDVTYDGISQHGHYCVPILLKGDLLGVLNLYVGHHHPQDLEEEAFLTTIANTLAGVVDRGLIEDRIHHMATHDALTDIPNRMLYQELLEQGLKQAARQKTQLAVVFVDLDRFKIVNDTLGHDAGDALLKAVTARIRECLRDSDTLARMGGDEFTLILPNIGSPENAMMVAEKIIHALQQPFDLTMGTCQIGASIGISLFPDHGVAADGLLEKADQAMYNVKHHGRNAAAIYHEEMA